MRRTETPKGERMVRIYAYLIRNRGRKYTAADIRRHLEQSEPVDLRNVQRDLKLLSGIRESCVLAEPCGGKLLYSLEPDMLAKLTLPIQRNGLLALFLLKRLQPIFAPGTSSLVELTQALRKFGSDLGDELFQDLDEQLGQQTRVLGEQSLLSLDGNLLNTVLEGLLKRRRLQLLYRRDLRGKPAPYTVCPAKLLLSGNELYLVCVFEPGQAKNYYFKVCRMTDVRLRGESFEFTPEQRKRIDDRLSRSFGLLDAVNAEPEKVVLRFPGWFETLLKEKMFHPTQKVKADSAGNAVCTFEAPIGDDLVRWVLGWGDEVTVESPESLKEKVRSVAKEIAGRY